MNVSDTRVGDLVVLTRPIFHQTGPIRSGRVGVVVGFSPRGSTDVVFGEHLIRCHGGELAVVGSSWKKSLNTPGKETSNPV